MQRWIVAGIGAMLLMMAGALFGYHHYKQNRPCPMWVPLPVNPELTVAKRESAAKDLKEKLANPAILLQVSKDLGLSAKWKLPSDKEAAAELGGAEGDEGSIRRRVDNLIGYIETLQVKP